MVWSDKRLTQWAINGGVTPFDESLVNGASIDLRLSDMVCFPQENYGSPIFRYGDKEDMLRLWKPAGKYESLLLNPGDKVLLSTLEVTRIPNNACAQILSKSTAGRCLIEHLHAGWGDPGFEGTWTLEIVNFSNVIWEILPGDRIVQLILLDLNEKASLQYGDFGRYQNQIEPTAPRGW